MPIQFGDHFILAGDGNIMQIIKKEKYEDDDGIDRYKFMFVASKRTIEMYNFQEGKELRLYEGIPVYIRSYSATDVIPIIEQPGMSRYFFKCNIKGEKTHVHRYFKDLKIELESLQKSYRSLQSENSRLHEEIKMITGDQEISAEMTTRIADKWKKLTKQVKEEEGAPTGE